MSQSILDQVLSSQRMSAISNFDPENLASKLMSILNTRELDILKKRHGLNGGEKITLEEIGRAYAVTRERVRQVENVSLKRIREGFKDTFLKECEYVLENVLEEHGEIMSEDRLIETLLARDKTTDANTAFVRFLLNQLIGEQFVLTKESSDMYRVWALKNAAWERYKTTIQEAAKILESYGEPLMLDELYDRTRNAIDYTDLSDRNHNVVFVNYLDITKHIEENKFNEWGLSHWSSIRPRRMNDKIYLVMKREGKPMHFTEIAKRINDVGFDSRVAYPATIHNELILDDKFVLVGRGIYALRDWGYKPGIVLDVIREVLSRSTRPLTRDEIINEVLKNRVVKRSTVMLALMNKRVFQKDQNGLYSLVTS